MLLVISIFVAIAAVVILKRKGKTGRQIISEKNEMELNPYDQSNSINEQYKKLEPGSYSTLNPVNDPVYEPLDDYQGLETSYPPPLPPPLDLSNFPGVISTTNVASLDILSICVPSPYIVPIEASMQPTKDDYEAMSKEHREVTPDKYYEVMPEKRYEVIPEKRYEVMAEKCYEVMSEKCSLQENYEYVSNTGIAATADGEGTYSDILY